MKIQVISDIGDDVYATVSTEEDAIRIDSAMNILLRGDASRIRSNPSDSEVLVFAQEHKLDSIGHIQDILRKTNIAVSGQDDRFVLSDKIVPFLKYFFGDFKVSDEVDLNFFTTLTALTSKERQTLVNGFRTLSKNNALGKASSSHDSTPNLQTLYIFSKLLPNDRSLGMTRLFQCLNSEYTLHEFFAIYNHSKKYQSLPITIEVLNAAVDKFLNFEITLPFFVDFELENEIKKNEYKILRSTEPYTEILGLKIYKEDLKASVDKFQTFFANAKSFNGNPQKAINDIIYYVGYISPHKFFIGLKHKASRLDYGICQAEVFYSVSLLCYILASSGEMYERLKETNVSASNCIKRILDTKSVSIKPSEIFDLFCRENFKPHSYNFFKRGFTLYAMYYELRARPIPQELNRTLFDRLLFEAYEANIEFLNDLCNLLFVEKVDLFNKPITNIHDLKIIKYLGSHLPTQWNNFDTVFESGRVVRGSEMHNIFAEIQDFTYSWKDTDIKFIEALKVQSVKDITSGMDAGDVLRKVISALGHGLNIHLKDLKHIIESEDMSDSIFDVGAVLNFINDLLEIDSTMISVFESKYKSPYALEQQWLDTISLETIVFDDLLSLYSPIEGGVRQGLSYLFEYFQNEPETECVNQHLRIDQFSMTRLSKFNPLILAVGLKEVSNCCMIYGGAGFSCCIDSFRSDDSQVYVIYDHNLEIFCGSVYAFPGDSMAIDFDNSEKDFKEADTYTCDQIEFSFSAVTKGDEYTSEVADNLIDMFYEFAINFDNDPDTVIINLSSAGGLSSSYRWSNSSEIVSDRYIDILDNDYGTTAKSISTQRNETYQDIQSTSDKILYICNPKYSNHCSIDYLEVAFCEECNEYVDAEDINWVDDGGICNECSAECSHCGGRRPKEEIYGSNQLCEDCGTFCDSCGDYVLQEEFSEDPDGEQCDNCYEPEDDDSEY